MWSKVDDKLHSHPKAQRAGDAMALWVMALSWCAAHLTNGRVPADQPIRLLGRSGPAMAKKLVTCGLWEEHEGGFRFHDYLDHNPDAEEVRAKRDEVSLKRKAAGKRGAAARWQNGKPDSKRDGKATASGMATACQADGNANGKTMAPSRPVPVQEEGESAHVHARTREAPPPPPPEDELTDDETEKLDAIAEGAEIVADRWDPRGARWQRKALARALDERGLSADDAFDLGQYLATDDAVRTHDQRTFAVDWIVFGSADAPEFKRLDWLWRETRAWRSRTTPAVAAPAKPNAKPNTSASSASPPNATNAKPGNVSDKIRKVREGFIALPKPITARSIDDEQPGEIEDEPNTTGTEQRGEESLGGVLEGILGAGR